MASQKDRTAAPMEATILINQARTHFEAKS